MPIPTNYRYDFQRGASKRVSFDFVQVNGEVEEPINLTGKNLEVNFQLAGAETPFFTLSLLDSPNANGSAISIDGDPADGVFEVFISKEDTLEFDKGQGTWWLMIIDGVDNERLWADYMLVSDLNEVIQ